MLTKEQTNTILDILDSSHVKHITMNDRTSEYCYTVSTCDSDVICFHKGKLEPWYFDKIVVCDSTMTKEPIYKDWYMTVAYHR
jgi:hypothetical protein